MGKRESMPVILNPPQADEESPSDRVDISWYALWKVGAWRGECPLCKLCRVEKAGTGAVPLRLGGQSPTMQIYEIFSRFARCLSKKACNFIIFNRIFFEHLWKTT
jgi:hypothetical protein